MAKRKTVPVEILRELLTCDPETGTLTWRHRADHHFSSRAYAAAWNTKFAGKKAFTYIGNNGYPIGNFMCRPFLAHRVIWAMTYGEWPEEIDHINGNRTDNRISNLRSVTHAQNLQNSKLRTTNSSGQSGVSWFWRTNSWQVVIHVNGEMIFLGYYKSKSKAIEVRKAAELKYDFHPNHGRVEPVLTSPSIGA